ncbi:MAG: DNA-3-methyladenine glycosylase [Thaumarchaeota archaeon]|nr:DNA-3-methyladenine glycosylase [Nitrososphaerota archaeon]
MKPLPIEFYARDTVTVAQEVLGKLLVRELNGVLLEGLIVESEAYRGSDDPASHAYRGITNRNKVMFGRAGVAYVYFTYGNHYCLNFTTEREKIAGAVLIRALQPLVGIDVMKRNRGTDDVHNLTSGPGKLTKAFSIARSENGLDLTTGKQLFVIESDRQNRFQIASSRRIGIREGSDKPWRFYIVDNVFVSRRGHSK